MSTSPSPLVQSVRSKYGDVYKDMSDADLEKAVLAKYPQYKDMASPSTAQPAVSSAPPESMGQAFMRTAGDVGTGMGKGAMHTLTGIGHLMVPDWLVGDERAKKAADTEKRLMTPSGTAQKIGFGGEQAAEFLVPGPAEEKVAGEFATHLPVLGKMAAPAARLATSALSSGAVNKLQGGSFGGGAAMGAGAGAIGEAGRAIAPSLAESALGVTKRMRGFGRTPGEAVLGEIKGIRPETIAGNAGDKIGQLTSELEQGASRSTVPATTRPAIQVVADEMQKAQRQNNKTLYNALKDVHEQLTKDFSSGNPLPTQMPASQVLDLKRGIGDLEGNWNPELRGKLKGTIRQVYSALDKELDRTVPEADKLNQRISSLIPVKERAASAGRGADVTQRVAHRMAAHTGALMGTGVGAAAGYREGGAPGAVLGGTLGLIAPEVLASPTSQMLGARVLRSGAPAKMGRAAASRLMSRESGESEK